MRAARLHPGSDEFTIEDVPVPDLAPGDVLVEVAAVGLCGSDLHILAGVTPTAFAPITLGHECAGIVAAVGSEVAEWAEGDAVVVNPQLTCGRCSHCREGRSQICRFRKVLGIHTDGAFAQFVRVPATNLFALPPGVSLREAAMIEPMGTPYHALTRRAPVTAGSRVAIVGVGGVGIHGVQIARVLGATTIVAIDLDGRALERAVQFGATHTIHVGHEDVAERIAAITGSGVDVALECVGLESTIRQSVEILDSGGVAAVLGIGHGSVALSSVAGLVRGERDVRGVYAYNQPQLEAVGRLLSSGRLNARQAISAEYALDDINHGLRHFRDRVDSPVRIVIRMDAGPEGLPPSPVRQVSP